MRPTLRPGLQVLRRDVRTLQLGRDWPGVATVRDSAALQAVLSAIDDFKDDRGVIMAAAASGLEPTDCEAALAMLVDAGAVVDQAAVAGGARRRSAGVAESTWSAWWLLCGPGSSAASLLQDRSTCQVLVRGDGMLADEIRRLLVTARVPVTGNPSNAQVVVLASEREPSRDLTDELMHSGLPHLWVCVRDLVGIVGPFVAPGVSACLRCVDLSMSDLDPAWPTLLASAAARPLAVPPAEDVHVALIAALAAQETLLWASQLKPQSFDRVIELPHGLGSLQIQNFPPHPQCGCGWASEHDTMGA